jgi:hypothetical protein
MLRHSSSAFDWRFFYLCLAYLAGYRQRANGLRDHRVRLVYQARLCHLSAQRRRQLLCQEALAITRKACFLLGINTDVLVGEPKRVWQ